MKNEMKIYGSHCNNQELKTSRKLELGKMANITVLNCPLGIFPVLHDLGAGLQSMCCTFVCVIIVYSNLMVH